MHLELTWLEYTFFATKQDVEAILQTWIQLPGPLETHENKRTRNSYSIRDRRP